MHVSSVMSAIGSGWTHRAGEAHVVSRPKGQIDGKVSEDDNGAARALFWPRKIAEIYVLRFCPRVYTPFTPFENQSAVKMEACGIEAWAAFQLA